MQRALPLLTTLIVTGAPPAQEWTVEQLEARTRGFLEEDPAVRLEQLGQLVRAAPSPVPAIAARLHGDHRQYLLKIERLVDRLTDERWLERERAERTLVEIGARARDRLARHAENGELLEERIRCQRILEKLDARGTEKEEQEARLLLGLARTALHLPPDESLRQALLSALGHTDRRVLEAVVRALGVHGRGDDAAVLAQLVRSPESGLRRPALAAIGRMPGDAAASLVLELLAGDELDEQESVLLLRAVRQRPDADRLLDEVAARSAPDVGSGASLRLDGRQGGGPEVRLRMTSGPEIEGRLAGVAGDTVVLAEPGLGPPRLELPFTAVRSVELPAEQPADRTSARVFTTQGSLLIGTLVGLQGDDLVVRSPVFGELALPRGSLQGIALDPRLDRLIGASHAVDRVRMADGSLRDGRVVGLSGEGVVLEDAEGAQHVLAREDVGGVMFRRPLSPERDPVLYTRVDLDRGDRLLGHLVAADAAELALVVPGVGGTVLPLQRARRIEFQVAGGALWGFTLAADYAENRIVEFDEHGEESFKMDKVYGAWDVECLPSGNLLLTEFSVSRVREVTREGTQVWAYEDLRNPYDADRLANGNTLIADTFKGQVIEVSPDGEVVWSYRENVRPFDVQRLENGNTLIADMQSDRVLEVTPAGDIAWERGNLPSIQDADRLPDGNTLVAQRTLNRVVELDGAGNEVWRLEGLSAPSDADRLPNGNTLVAENTMVREFDRHGNEIWRRPMSWAVEANRY